MTGSDEGFRKGYDFADRDRDEGPGAVNNSLEAVEPVAPNIDGCPAAPLGRRASEYFFVSQSGEFRALRERELTQVGILSLFDGQTVWLAEKFHARPGQLFHLGETRAWLIQACVKACLFDTDAPIRKLGVWRPLVPAMSGSVAHLGRKQPQALMCPDMPPTRQNRTSTDILAYSGGDGASIGYDFADRYAEAPV